MKRFSNTFIFSLTSLRDNLNQWRLYGDDGQGVCLCFKPKKSLSIEGNPDIQLRRIYYGTEIIDFFRSIKRIVEEEFNCKFITEFVHFRNFFKIKDYEDEKEIRLRISGKEVDYEKNWGINRFDILNAHVMIPFENFPLELKGVILGPKLKEVETNEANIKHFIRESGKKPISIIKSTIDCYR